MNPIHEEVNRRFLDKDLSGALAMIDYGLAQNSYDVALYRAKARVYFSMRDLAKSERWYGAVITHSPPKFDDYDQRATVRNALSDYRGTIEDMNVAIAMRGDNADCYLKRGGAYWELKDWDRADADFKKALEIAPTNADVVWVNGLLDLQLGRFDTGWERYESRWDSNRFKSNRLVTSKPRWEPGLKRVLVWGEQGLGDQIFYSSTLHNLRAQVDKVTMMIDRRLVSLFSRSMPRVQFVPNTSEIDVGEHDSHLPIASISSRFVHSLDDIRRKVATSYLKPDPDRVAEVREKLNLGNDKLVALSWTSAAVKIGPHKSMSLEDLEPILSIPGYRFVNVQYVNSATDQRDPRVEKAPVDCVKDMEGLAALLSLCYSLVSVSSSTVHLAAAIGVPVLLADANKLWYWNNREGDRSLWYPSVRVFPRDHIMAPWANVVESMRKILDADRKFRMGVMT